MRDIIEPLARNQTCDFCGGVGTSRHRRIPFLYRFGTEADAVHPRVAWHGGAFCSRSLITRHSHHVQERFGAVYLDAKHRIVREREIFVGMLNSAIVSTRDVLRFALDDHAAAVIVFHNHPSGDPSPSAEDLLFTRKLVEAGKVLGIDVLDHLVLGSNRYVSLNQRGMM